MNTWITADTHYGHLNIVKKISKWTSTDTLRDFDSVEDMNDLIVERINSVVETDDILWHLGDWSFNGYANVVEFKERLYCKNIHIVLGNHDHLIAGSKTLQSMFSSVQSLYIESVDMHDDVINRILKSKEIKRNIRLLKKTDMIGVTHGTHFGQSMVLCHINWGRTLNIPDNTILLHGHSHGKLLDLNTSTFDVGIDTHDFMPYSVDEIIQLIKTKNNK